MKTKQYDITFSEIFIHYCLHEQLNQSTCQCLHSQILYFSHESTAYDPYISQTDGELHEERLSISTLAFFVTDFSNKNQYRNSSNNEIFDTTWNQPDAAARIKFYDPIFIWEYVYHSRTVVLICMITYNILSSASAYCSKNLVVSYAWL